MMCSVIVVKARSTDLIATGVIVECLMKRTCVRDWHV
jgi:hypothetical protein